jgi:hypothetical protein
LRRAVETILDRAVDLINESAEADYQVTKEALEEGAEIFKASTQETK